jgi:hypothetical protein
MPVGRFYKELERILKEAVSVKDEFKSMEAIRGGIQWVRTFIWWHNLNIAMLGVFFDARW